MASALRYGRIKRQPETSSISANALSQCLPPKHFRIAKNKRTGPGDRTDALGEVSFDQSATGLLTPAWPLFLEIF
jgi:hypothetical protein